MDARSEAFANYGEAAILEMLVKVLPDVVGAAAAPLSAVDKMTVISTDGAGVAGPVGRGQRRAGAAAVRRPDRHRRRRRCCAGSAAPRRCRRRDAGADLLRRRRHRGQRLVLRLTTTARLPRPAAPRRRADGARRHGVGTVIRWDGKQGGPHRAPRSGPRPVRPHPCAPARHAGRPPGHARRLRGGPPTVSRSALRSRR